MKKFALFPLLLLAGGVSKAQPPASVLQTESRVVLVDSVVTDKKGTYLRDLTEKNFRVFEDEKEQTITSFSFEGGQRAAAKPQVHYMVLFFDNSGLEPAEQPRVRGEALKFVEANNVSENRMIAVVNYGGSMQVAQNFTNDTELLRNVINGVKSGGTPEKGLEGATKLLAEAASDLTARSMLLALRNLARGMSRVPGRKSVVLLSPGFKFRSEDQAPELSAALAECSRANVVIYALDVRGLIAGLSPGFLPRPAGVFPFLLNAGYNHSPLSFAQSMFYFFQSRPAAPPPANTSRPTVAAPPAATPSSPGEWSDPRTLARTMGPGMQATVTGTEILQALSDGSGGFLIKNTNDLSGGIAKINKEQDEYYLLGYTPSDAADFSCHRLRVALDVKNAVVRARPSYCSSNLNVTGGGNVMLGGVEKQLEDAVAVAAASKSPADTPPPGTPMMAPFFYTAPNVARVNVAMEIPLNNLKIEPYNGKLRAQASLLGIAYRKDGSVAARFTDRVRLDFDDQKRMNAAMAKPLHYEYEFSIAPGDYTLKVAYTLSKGQVGSAVAPLTVGSYDTTAFALSGVALSRQYAPVNDARANVDAAWMQGRTPLIAAGTLLLAGGSSTFRNTDLVAIYAEIYEPLLLAPPDPKTPVAVAVALRILDRSSGAEKLDTGLMRAALPEKTGNPVIPIVIKMPISGLAAGAYVLELEAGDVTGRAVKRLTNFDIE